MGVVFELYIACIKGDGDVGPLGVSVGSFDCHMVHASHVFFALSFVSMILIAPSGDGEDCAVGQGWVIYCCLSGGILLVLSLDLGRLSRWWRWEWLVLHRW